MKWAYQKPQFAGYYFRRMQAVGMFSAQPAHLVFIDGEGGVWQYDPMGEWEHQAPVTQLSDQFEWAGPVEPPEEGG